MIKLWAKLPPIPLHPHLMEILQLSMALHLVSWLSGQLMGSVAANHPAVKRTTIINNPDPAGRTFAKSTFQSFRLIRPRAAPNAFGHFCQVSHHSQQGSRAQSPKFWPLKEAGLSAGTPWGEVHQPNATPRRDIHVDIEGKAAQRKTTTYLDDSKPFWVSYTIHHGTITIKVDVEAVESRGVWEL
jgi:hypothetical protein